MCAGISSELFLAIEFTILCFAFVAPFVNVIVFRFCVNVSRSCIQRPLNSVSMLDDTWTLERDDRASVYVYKFWRDCFFFAVAIQLDLIFGHFVYIPFSWFSSLDFKMYWQKAAPCLEYILTQWILRYWLFQNRLTDETIWLLWRKMSKAVDAKFCDA